ncbi:uncharacterized protein [Cherax quadricarinatus]|uniref:uncharacterized protein isoform X1 n=1 Tax=Cherax quadricarinatus TaxID=27406 RepID=UPI00387E4CC8
MKVVEWWCVMWLLCYLPHTEATVQTVQEVTHKEEIEIILEDIEEVIAEEEQETEDSVVDDILLDDVQEPGDHCLRYSPKEVFHTHLHPTLIAILDELSLFVESVLSRMESSLRTLLPHVDQSPVGKMKIEEVFGESRHFMLGTMKDVYQEIIGAWRNLIHTHATPSHIHAHATPSHIHAHATPSHILTALHRVREAQQEGEQRLVMGLGELFIILKAVVLNSIYVIQSSVKVKNDTQNVNDTTAVLNTTIPEVSPNFLGSLMVRMMTHGRDSSGYQKILRHPLRSITTFVDQMYSSLATLVENGGGEGEMEDYWRSTLVTVHHHMKQSLALGEISEATFSNEEQLADLVLQMMASY